MLAKLLREIEAGCCCCIESVAFRLVVFQRTPNNTEYRQEYNARNNFGESGAE